MAVMINGFTITSLERIHGYDRVDKSCALLLTELQNATLNATEDTSDITGKGGRVLKQIKKNKGLGVTGASALISGDLLAAQTGSDQVVADADHKIKVRLVEVFTIGASDTYVTLSESATGTAGHEIIDFRIVTDNGGLLKTPSYSQAATTADASHFVYDSETKKVTLPTDSTNIKAGTQIAIFYDFETANASSVKDLSDVFGKTLYLIIDAIATDVCDNEYKCQFIIPRAQFSGTFSIEMGGDQTVHNFEATTLVDTCAGTTTGELFEFIVYQ